MILEKWIQPQHLTADTMAELRRKFDQRPIPCMYIDDFMDTERLASIRNVVLHDGVMETLYKLYDRNEWVSKEVFYAAPEEQRFIFETMCKGYRPGREMSPSVLSHLRLKADLARPAFHAWLSAVTGKPVDDVAPVILKALGRRHFLRWHNDAHPQRTVCAVLYLHQGWEPDYGGRLLMKLPDGTLEATEPRFNRLVLFSPQPSTRHAVEPMTEAAGDWLRLSYTAWFRNLHGEAP
jgi:Rps23 Pro-64 3,4-dihydroxylase Tpa1-like proline 4-hydroxylase